MDIYTIRQELRSKSIFDLKLRVTFYARVSTDSDDQRNSLENQAQYYEEYIRSNKNWVYVPGYVDEGISGISTKRRENFNMMIDDAHKGKFDFIITKELSRFARNTLDSIKYTRELLNCGVCVFFQGDGINTIDDDSELRLTIMSGIAQDELRKLSSRVKFGHQQAIKNGVVLGNSRIFGYEKQDGRLVINEEEAVMVREVYELYATDKYSLKQIETILYEKGYRNHNGNKIAHTTLSNMIANPKYKGYYVGNKVKVIDLFTKKQKFLEPDQWVMYKDETGDIVPSIVDEELWERANDILQRRSADVKSRQNKYTHANLLTGKLYCAHCNVYYYRKDANYKGTYRSRWVCSGKLKNGPSSCDSFALSEDDVKTLLFSVFSESYKDSEKYIDEFIDAYKQTFSSDTKDRISLLRSKIDVAQKKKSKLLQFNVQGKISDDDFAIMYRECEDEIATANEELTDLLGTQEQMAAVEKEIRSIKRQLKEAVENIEENADISPAFINKYIKRIVVTPESDSKMKLDIQLFTGENLEKALVRSGHMRKKICPERTDVIRRIDRTAIGHMVEYRIDTCLTL